MIKFTEEEYLQTVGEQLGLVLPTKDDGSSKVKREINNICDFVYTWVASNNQFPIPKDEDLSDLQKDNIKKAEIWQLAYIIENGDISNMSGYEETGVTANRDYLELISLSSRSYSYLKACGIVRNNILSSQPFIYPFGGIN